MDSDRIWHHIDTERAALADLLAGLSAAQWDAPSLCAGWRVRDVAAHVASAHITLTRALVPLLRARFDFATMIRDSALRSPLTHLEIVATIRGFVGSRRTPPFVTEMEPLIDVLVHTQDICVPLGIETAMPLEAAAAAADRVLVLNEQPRYRLRPPLTGVRLVADDLDWAHGSGAEVTGAMSALLLLTAGRDAAARPRLRGDVAALGAPPGPAR